MTLAEWIINKYKSMYCLYNEGDNRKNITDKQIQSILDIMGREKFVSQAKELEREKLIEVKWNLGRTDTNKIIFELKNIDRLYEYAQIENSKKKIAKQLVYLELIKEQYKQECGDNKNSEWIINYIDTCCESVRKGNAANNAYDKMFLKCLIEISKIDDAIWKRKFSLDVLGNTKEFQNVYQSRVITELRKKIGKSKEEMTDDKVLEEFGIMTYSQQLSWKGNVIYYIQYDNEKYFVDSSNQKFGTVINAQTLVNAKIVDLPSVKRIITIENQANYEDKKYDENILYIYVHGFLSPKERNFLSGINDIISNDIEVLHWGDMDLGGMRIFKFLKDNLFPNIKPYKMDVETYYELLDKNIGNPVEASKLKKYNNLEIAELDELKKAILENGIEIEQESLM